MENSVNEEVLLRRNLRDAGCSPSSVDQFMQLRREGKSRDQLRLLSAQRVALLKKVHDNQLRIDCLDHLVFTMKDNAGE